MVTGFLGSDANGIYAVACKIPTILTLIAGIFLEAWQFSAVSEARGSRNAHIHFYSQIWSAFQGVMFFAGSLIIAFSHWEIRMLSTESYYSAWQYMPVLSMAMIFASFVTFMGSVYMVEKKSGLSFWTAMIGAAVNILLNLILIPTQLGVQGAALATLASYFLSFLIRAVSARRLIPFDLHTGRLTAGALVLSVQTVFIICRFPMWDIVQAVCIVILLILNIKPFFAAFRKVKQVGTERRLYKK